MGSPEDKERRRIALIKEEKKKTIRRNIVTTRRGRRVNLDDLSFAQLVEEINAPNSST